MPCVTCAVVRPPSRASQSAVGFRPLVCSQQRTGDSQYGGKVPNGDGRYARAGGR